MSGVVHTAAARCMLVEREKGGWSHRTQRVQHTIFFYKSEREKRTTTAYASQEENRSTPKPQPPSPAGEPGANHNLHVNNGMTPIAMMSVRL